MRVSVLLGGPRGFEPDKLLRWLGVIGRVDASAGGYPHVCHCNTVYINTPRSIVNLRGAHDVEAGGVHGKGKVLQLVPVP